jgi:hypothetical protein
VTRIAFIGAGSTSVSAVGICYAVQGTAGDLARDLGVPAEEVDYFVTESSEHFSEYVPWFISRRAGRTRARRTPRERAGPS